MKHYFDRSRLETSFKCPRREYWEYYYDGKGLQPARLNQHLVFGSAVHEAVGAILQYCVDFDNLPDAVWIKEAINISCASLRQVFTASKGFTAEPILEEGFDGQMIQTVEDQSWLVDHYCDLLEGLVTGWCLVRLPALMEQYRVVTVETEERLQLGSIPSVCVDEGCPHYGTAHSHKGAADELVFMSRPDAILERRTDGALVILSLKTVSQVNSMWLENFKTDQQTISEVLPVEARLGREVAGVQIEGLTKCAMAVDWPKGSGHKHHASPLIWGYLTEAGGLDLEWKAQWEWKDEAGNSRRLGKGWNRQRISERYPGGIAAWVQWLYDNEQELLRAQFPSPPLISRSANELEEWQTTVIYREQEVHNALVQIAFRQGTGILDGDGAPATNSILAKVFPKHTTGCAYDPQFHSKCPQYENCWGSTGSDPIGSGNFVYRVSNHPEEG